MYHSGSLLHLRAAIDIYGAANPVVLQTLSQALKYASRKPKNWVSSLYPTEKFRNLFWVS
jgi:hypothetical protein